MPRKDTSTATPRGRRRRQRGFYERFGKPALDRFVAVPAALVTLPFVILLAAISSVVFRGTGISRDARVGRDGRRFNIYRIRTTPLRSGDERGRRRQYGQFLRAWSLDELPQLWNIILGQMSMVGPRPITPAMASDLKDWQRHRHEIKPGITGLWQVEARGDGRALFDNIHYDIQYIDQQTLATDFRILVRTIAIVATRREGPPLVTGKRSQRIRSRFPHIRLVAADMSTWALALSAAAAARLDFSWKDVDKSSLLWACALAISVQTLWGFAFGLYRGKWRLGSYDELTRLAAGTVLTSGVLLATTLREGANIVPRGAIVTGGAFFLIGALSTRYIARGIYAIQGRSVHPRPHKMLIFGAGDAGPRAGEAIWKDQESDALPVAFLDDDPSTHRSRRLGLPVVGGHEAIAVAAKRYNADTLLIAMPSAPGAAIARVADAAQSEGLRVRILPRLAKFVSDSGGEVLTSDIRDLTLAHFLGREEIRLDLEEIARYLRGKRVLVTGAGGSVGSVLCEIVEEFEPKKIYKLDHNENALHGLQLGMEGRALLDSDDLVLCDIRDRDAVYAIVSEIRPQVVFHAAAHKHVTFLERHPQEAIKTNILGTLNMLGACHESRVQLFVNVSTDKAAEPVNMLGMTKRAAEMLTSYFAKKGSGEFMSVRFGNVLGSTGSVIPTFRSQIASGKPITVTDARATRYFMTIREACQLVVQAGSLEGNGDVFVLDMGKPVRIVDLARRLQAELKPGTVPDIIYTGLRPGEKLHETLVGRDEQIIDRPHDLLTRYRVPTLSPDLFDPHRDLGIDELAGLVNGRPSKDL